MQAKEISEKMRQKAAHGSDRKNEEEEKVSHDQGLEFGSFSNNTDTEPKISISMKERASIPVDLFIMNDLQKKYGKKIPGDKELLGDIQGNILTPHGREHARYLFIRFNLQTQKNIEEARDLIRLAATGVRNDPDVRQRVFVSRQPKYLLDIQDLDYLWNIDFKITSAGSQFDESAKYRMVKEDSEELEKHLKLFKRMLNLGESRDEMNLDLDEMSVKREFLEIPVGQNLFVNFFLSSSGYRALGFKEVDIPQDESFKAGMKSPRVNAWLADPPTENWSPEYRSDIHAMLLLAHSDKEILSRVTDILKIIIGKYGIFVAEEIGWNRRKDGEKLEVKREHFGFKDGFSQPVFLIPRKDNPSPIPRNWSSEAPLSMVLTPAPDGSFGSYFAYRKLEQDVWKWNAVMQSVALTLSDSEIKSLAPNSSKGISDARYDVNARTEAAGAYMMGRRTDGSSVSHGQEDSSNDFAYNSASKCPFHAHIRRANPREAGSVTTPGTKGFDARTTLVRRGMPYGRDSENISGDKSLDRGLLFLSAQSGLQQFEIVQKRLYSSDSKSGYGAGPASMYENVQKGNPVKPLGIMDAVSFKGGEYFFAPALSTLENLNSSKKGT
jgi:Dyp-type peroxidase family